MDHSKGVPLHYTALSRARSSLNDSDRRKLRAVFHEGQITRHQRLPWGLISGPLNSDMLRLAADNDKAGDISAFKKEADRKLRKGDEEDQFRTISCFRKKTRPFTPSRGMDLDKLPSLSCARRGSNECSSLATSLRLPDRGNVSPSQTRPTLGTSILDKQTFLNIPDSLPKRTVPVGKVVSEQPTFPKISRSADSARSKGIPIYTSSVRASNLETLCEDRQSHSACDPPRSPIRSQPRGNRPAPSALFRESVMNVFIEDDHESFSRGNSRIKPSSSIALRRAPDDLSNGSTFSLIASPEFEADEDFETSKLNFPRKPVEKKPTRGSMLLSQVHAAHDFESVRLIRNVSSIRRSVGEDDLTDALRATSNLDDAADWFDNFD